MTSIFVTPDTTDMTDRSASLHPLTDQLPPVVTRVDMPSRVQASYTTRFVGAAVDENPAAFHLLFGDSVVPRSGDVVIARVTEILNHKRVETPASRKAILFQGALIMLAYGNRYAADQFLAHVPDSLQPCHLVAAGGIAGTVTLAHEDMEDPTIIEPIGLLANQHGVVNIADFAPHRIPAHADAVPPVLGNQRRPEVIAVLGTAMNSGKSTTMACLINGLTASGRRVTAGKITGTGAGNDPMIYHDAGAARVLDFTDFGYPTTFKLNMADIKALTLGLVEELSDAQTDVVVVEIADGIYQEETAQLLRDEVFQDTIDQVVFSATDALGARAGVQELQAAGLHVAVASGVMTASPLATIEARQVLDVPVIPTFDLTHPEEAAALLVRS
ncbi:DUF1611 domain-containing protein [Enteractinococcus helveticum]|nr:DUF1611 domain-containing protein [Enteractinococcus helveticum]